MGKQTIWLSSHKIILFNAKVPRQPCNYDKTFLRWDHPETKTKFCYSHYVGKGEFNHHDIDNLLFTKEQVF